MIAADMLSFVQSDLTDLWLRYFARHGRSAMWIIFRGWKWVVDPLGRVQYATATLLLGVLAATDWRMTVISSNSVAVLLIVTLSLSIHLVVRYRELHRAQPAASRT